MNPSRDEYEEVESPFSTTTSERVGSSTERLRSRKNVFNRPFAADSTVAPTVFETTTTRKSIGRAEDIDINHHRKSNLLNSEIEYLNDEQDEEAEEAVESRPARVNRSTSTSKKASRFRKNLLAKIGWVLIGLLVLRLIFMDRGVMDYFVTESAIKDKKSELLSIHQENKELSTEISRIQLDRNYQRQLAKEHLGVIAADEFLILFAGESAETPNATDRQY